MYRNLHSTLILSGLALLLGACVASADDNLFSDIEINSVFSTPATSSNKQVEKNETAERVRSVDHLGRLLRIEGFGFERAGSRTFSATTSLKDWSFPALVTLSENRNRIGFILGLVSYDEASSLSRDKMLQLLIANQGIAPVQFSFNKDRQRTELVLVIENQNVDSGRLATEIENLKKVAAASVEYWTDEEISAADDTVAKSQESKDFGNGSPSEKPNDMTASLVGRWQFAKSSTEAFALAITADGKFTLVRVANGTPVTSTGNYSLSAGNLTLDVPNGLTLVGPIELQSADQFRFTPNATSKPLVFDRVK